MKLRQIKSSDQIPQNAIYYSTEYERRGRDHIHWYALYDMDFRKIEDVEILYINAISGLIRIVKADRINDVSLQMYKMIKLNDNFYKVVKDEDTAIATECITNSVKPKTWR